MKFKKKNKIYVKKDAGNVPYNNEVFNNSTGNMPTMSESAVDMYDELDDDFNKKLDEFNINLSAAVYTVPEFWDMIDNLRSIDV